MTRAAFLAVLLMPCAALAQRTGGSFGARAWGSRPVAVSRPAAAPSRPAPRIVWAHRIYAPAPRPTPARDVVRTVVAVRRVYRSASRSPWWSAPAEPPHVVAVEVPHHEHYDGGGCAASPRARGSCAAALVLCVALAARRRRP